MTTEANAQATNSPINMADALERCGQDPAFLDEMLHEFLDFAGSQLEQLRGAVDASNADALAREAHSIKGAAANLGAETLAKAALELELCGKQQHLQSHRDLLEKLNQEVRRLNEFVNPVNPAPQTAEA